MEQIENEENKPVKENYLSKIGIRYYRSDQKRKKWNIVSFERKVTSFLRLCLALITVVGVLFATHFVYEELNTDDFVMHGFEVPSEFEKNGITNRVLVDKISVKLAEMKQMTRSSFSENRKYNPEEQGRAIQVELHGVGVSLQTVVEQLRQIFRIERRYINGYLIQMDNRLQLTVHVTGRSSEIFEQNLDSLDRFSALEKLLGQASEVILQNTDPIVMLNYYFQTKKQGRNIELGKFLLIHEPKYTHWAYLSWASGLRLEGKNEESVEMLKRAIEAKPDFSDAWNSWGSILRNQKKYDEAIEKYQKAIEANPDYLLPYNNLAFVHFLKGEYDLAIQKSQELITRNPEFGYPYSIIAQCYAKKSNEEFFYKNLEIALKYKVPVWTWLNTDPWNGYVGQERFDNLIAKYRLD